MGKFKPTYDIGYKGKAVTGETFTVTSYKGRKEITIQFDCGYSRRVTSTQIKQGKVLYKKVSKAKLGDTLTHPLGMSCTITKYSCDSDMTVTFENGEVRKTSYANVLNGKVSYTVPLSPIKVGEVFPTSRYGNVTVIKYTSPWNVSIVFDEGTSHNVHSSALRRGNVGHPKSGIPEGYIFTNRGGVTGEVYKYHSPHSVDVVWEDGVITKGHAAAMIRRGTLYYPNEKTVVGVGYFGIGRFISDRCGKTGNYNKTVYRKWMHMINRCYNPYEINKESCKAYMPVEVCEDWKCFQNFAEWAEDKLHKFVDGFELDKDMFGTGLLYTPEYCTLLPDKVNSFLSDNYSSKSSGLPDGVNVIKPNPKYPNSKVGYCARCHINGVREYLGYYDTPEEAGDVYRVAKEKEAKRLAEEYRNVLSGREYLKLKAFTLEDIHRK